MAKKRRKEQQANDQLGGQLPPMHSNCLSSMPGNFVEAEYEHFADGGAQYTYNFEGGGWAQYTYDFAGNEVSKVTHHPAQIAGAAVDMELAKQMLGKLNPVAVNGANSTSDQNNGGSDMLVNGVNGLDYCPACFFNVKDNIHYCPHCEFGLEGTDFTGTPRIAGYKWNSTLSKYETFGKVAKTTDLKNKHYNERRQRNIKSMTPAEKREVLGKAYAAEGGDEVVSFDKVVLNDSKKQQILDAVSQINNQYLIFDEWGFGEKFEKGYGISMLFWGVPGTGKTLTAEAIANNFGYEMQLIDTAMIESSEPGQAERNIKAIFENAGKDKVLVFDECDSLIQDRNSVGMIIGAQINALLTSLEKFEGITVFTTNRLGRLDPAFDRRLSLKLEFEMPAVNERVKIWQNMFPKKAPMEKDINWERIASVEVAGGHIKNVVLRAARVAANSSKKVITEDIIIDALQHEVYSHLQFTDAINESTLPRFAKGGQQGAGQNMDKQGGLSRQVERNTSNGSNNKSS